MRTRERHGMSETPIYTSWEGMKRRCYNPRFKHFQQYGGRGIRVCDEWHKFLAFYADMGEKPSPAHTLDRIDNDGNYEPSNCRWATREEQANNTRSNRNLELNGTTRTVAEWARSLNMHRNTLDERLHNGWPIEKALTEPVDMSKSHR